MAALAALWGHSFATVKASKESLSRCRPRSRPTGEPSPESGRTSNKISGGTFHQPVIQGRDITGPGSAAAASRPPMLTED